MPVIKRKSPRSLCTTWTQRLAILSILALAALAGLFRFDTSYYDGNSLLQFDSSSSTTSGGRIIPISDATAPKTSEPKETPAPPPSAPLVTTGESEVLTARTTYVDEVLPEGRTSNIQITNAGVDVSDPTLWEGEDLHGDSSTTTVMGMASGYDLSVYQRFVGSLRRTGYKGHIILGVAPNVAPKVLDYFAYRKVQGKIMSWGKCTYRKSKAEKRDIFKNTQCEASYPDIKVRWSRFPLQADWLRACETCTGPVLTMDVRDSFFQLDPFGEGSPVVKGLQVFEEDPQQTTQHWLASWPIRDCKGLVFTRPMLCSGTTVGTRTAMLKYFDVMYAEMKHWIVNETCRFDINGDDQSIHNYLYYTGQLPFAKAVKNRSGGIVNTVGKTAAMLRKQHLAVLKDKKNMTESEAEIQPFEGANYETWISEEYKLTNGQGFFIEHDGSLSRVIHQYDRFGLPFNHWLSKQKFIVDEKDLDIPSRPEETRNNGNESKALMSNEEEREHNTQAGNDLELFDPEQSERKSRTLAGVDVSDPQLFQEVDLEGDSSTATVMGMASGYDLSVYERFVGTLRKSGFQGNIILGVAPDVSQKVLDYFKYRNVTPKIMQWATCTYKKIESDKKDIFKQTTCEKNYPDIKIRWSRFPLQADWLRECKECTGPVLVMDVRDSYFQLDPFGEGSPSIKGLQVFEEHPAQTTTHWLTNWPIKQCKGFTMVKPMLCSGTTIGTREAMLKYLDIMYAEMKKWIVDEKCRFDINGDDQSIHNYLYYTGQLPFATAIKFRDDGIVNTVGKLGAMINKEHAAHLLETKGLERGDAMWKPFPGATKTTWIGAPYNITDDQGFFIENSGRRSRVIHQFDRFGRPLVNLWMDKNPYFKDPMREK